MENYHCRLCSKNDFEIIYEGKIRSGGVGSEFIFGHHIRKCFSCGFISLFPLLENIDDFYESEQYRKEFFDEISVSDLQKKFDHEQNIRLSKIGIENLRGKTIGDFGAGPGLFLDSIKGIANKTIAIEPTKIYHKYFEKVGHSYFSYPKDLLESNIKLDVAISFDTVEHIENINEFVLDIYKSLNKGGIFYLSMPNHNDVVKLLLPDKLDPFLYMKAHLNYFTSKTANKLLENCGFKLISSGFVHKYKLSNIVQWATKGKPGSFDTSKVFDNHFDTVFVNEINRLGLSSHLFIIAQK